MFIATLVIKHVDMVCFAKTNSARNTKNGNLCTQQTNACALLHSLCALRVKGASHAMVEYVCGFRRFTPYDGKKRKRIATPPRSKTILGSFCPPTAKSASA